jgi:hypothetical protein
LGYGLLGKGVPRLRVEDRLTLEALGNHAGTELKEKTGHRAASWTTINPEDQGGVFGFDGFFVDNGLKMVYLLPKQHNGEKRRPPPKKKKQNNGK